MNIEITKTDLDKAVVAAREPKGHIFSLLEESINLKADEIGMDILGAAGIRAAEEAGSLVCHYTKQLACVGAFLQKMRGLDLVLTSTGFGVVSTQDTAPASKMRVDALEGELRKKERLLRSLLLETLFDVEGWSDSIQRHENVETLFWRFTMLQLYAGITNPDARDWDSNIPAMMTADSFLRKHIGNAFMNELLDQMTSNRLTQENARIVRLCRRFIGAWISQNHSYKESAYKEIINTLEADLERYPTYQLGEGYKLNHFKPYENHAEDSAFHFVG